MKKQKNKQGAPLSPQGSDFWFLPLGGSGEIGMNLNLYGYQDQWLMVDLGITFNDRFGIDVVMPDPTFAIENKDKLVGLVLTHAHEDHVGAVPYLWPYLRCPIYATPFTATIVREKIKEYSWAKDVQIIEVPLSGRVTIGHYEVEFVTLTHSIPEPNALSITTPAGTIMHSGDWKIDPKPLVGEVTDEAKLREIGDKGVLAMVCDSTNVFTEGVSGSEEDVRKELMDVVAKYPDNRVSISCFSSNVARLETAALVAKACGRRVALIGRSLFRMTEAAKKNGYLSTLEDFVDAQDAMSMPPSKVMFVCTGSQGEPRSALARIASGQYKGVHFDERDVVIFSSRMIPGNEKTIAAMQNQLVRKGVKLVTAHEADVHVSGHPARDELKAMYSWVRPQILVPVHGEMRHMMAQAELGKSVGIAHTIVPENGTIVALSKDAPPAIIHRVPVGRWGCDGNRVVPMENDFLADRGRMAVNGGIFMTIAMDKSGRLKGLTFSIVGLLNNTELPNFEKMLEQVVYGALKGKNFKTVAELKDEVRLAVRRKINHKLAKKPLVEIHVMVGA